MPRQFIRALRRQPRARSAVAAFREALAQDGLADVFDERTGAETPVFRVSRAGPAVLARTPEGRCLAVTVDPMLAVVDAFSALDREDAARATAPRRRQRARTREANAR